MDTFLQFSGLNNLQRLNKRQVYYQFINFAMIVSSALMIWKGMVVATGSESPVVVVLSGSMEPAFHRGDILFLTHDTREPYSVGDIVVFRIDGRSIPIVHRIIRLHTKKDGSVRILTKGDNNSVDDRGLYATDQLWLEEKHIMGRTKGTIPYVGMITILMNDYPKIKLIILGLLGLFVLTQRE